MGELTRDVSEQTATLVRKELALATAELKEKGRHAGLGAGLFGGAGLITIYALGALVATAILGLAEVVDAWLAALIVTIVLAVIAGVAALIGKREVEQATPARPERAQTEVKIDAEAVKEAARR